MPPSILLYIYSIKPQCWQKRGKIPLFGTHQAENSGVQWALERTGKYQDFLLEIREKDGGEIEEGGGGEIEGKRKKRRRRDRVGEKERGGGGDIQ